MSQNKETVVRLQALDGQWEVCGVERLRGITPDISPMVTGPWGPDTAGFDLRRDPKAIWPDLRTWTPCEIEIGGIVIWDGYVKGAPSRDGVDQVMSVQCQGWQYHLDENIYRRTYVHDRITDWKDARSVPTQDLTLYATAGSVQAGEGSVLLGWPSGAVVAANARVGITLDLGPGPADVAAAASVLTQGVTGQPATSPTVYLFVRGHELPAEGPNYADLVSGGNALSVLGTNPNALRGAFTTAYRYVTIFLYAPTGGTFAGDCSLQIQFARIFTDDGFRIPGGDASVLTSPLVIADALDRATLRLSDDRSRIDPTNSVSFGIPSLAPAAERTPREMWESSNAYYDYRSQIAIGRIPIYEPRPSVAEIEVGNWSAMEADGITPQSDEEIYNRVVVTGTTPAGTLIRVERFAGHDEDAPFTALSGLSAPNPTFDANATGWSGLVGGAITRTTTAGEFDSSPAGGKFTVSSGIQPGYATTTLLGTAKRGRVYRITARIRTATTNTFMAPSMAINDTGPASPAEAEVQFPVSTGGGFITARLLWCPKVDTTNPVVYFATISDGVTPSIVYIDSMQVEISAATLVDRQGFVRSKELQVRSPLPADGIAAAMIGDAFLRAHSRTAFKGPIKLTGDHSVRHVLTGVPVPLERLQFYTHKLLRFNDRIDPDTSAQGRDAQIEQVTYDPKTNEATVTMDEQRAGFEALMERLAVVTGGG